MQNRLNGNKMMPGESKGRLSSDGSNKSPLKSMTLAQHNAMTTQEPRRNAHGGSSQGQKRRNK